VAVILVSALLPLGLAGALSWTAYRRAVSRQAEALHRHIVEGHAHAIDQFLVERKRALLTATAEVPVSRLATPERLQVLLIHLNDTYRRSFVDLGVIDHQGRHLAYVGPYALLDKNYAKAPWFQAVLQQGSHISDVFLGFRKEPHLVIAVRRGTEKRPWILRATILSQRFVDLVRSADLGETGEAFLVNRAGVYQTPPPRGRGRVLGRSPLRGLHPHPGARTLRIEDRGRELIQTTSWLNDGRWMFVVRQAEAEVLAPARQAMVWGSAALAVALLVLGVITVLATRHLTQRIALATAERDAAQRDLLRSSRLASLGEMATGLAHEINNPLAIIDAEQTNLGDAISDLPDPLPGRDELIACIDRCHHQVARCGAITSKMLQCGRHRRSQPEPTDLRPRLVGIVELLSRQAAVRNIDLSLDLPPGPLWGHVDPTELEQVMMNLLNNAFAAIPRKGQVRISAERRPESVRIHVRDTGAGIAPDHLGRVFEPFFTTKPVGQGTGLGLSVCFGLVQGWGGTLTVDSALGQGSTFTLEVPCAPDPAPEPMAEAPPPVPEEVLS